MPLHSLPGQQAHVLLELLAYFIGARFYWRAARTHPLPAAWIDRLALLAGAVLGAALGSKLLHVFEHLPTLLARNDAALWLGGKSVLGGFIGGTLGVEIAKRLVGWHRTTGDAWVPALAVGLMIGRMGCQLSGTWDQTYGIPTSLPWAWDYGDGIGRHPTGLYEILLVALLFFSLWFSPRLQRAAGARFAVFLTGYCAIRLLLEFLTPPFGALAEGTLPVAIYGGLTAIQWLALVGILGYGLLTRARLRAVNR
jgi:prolipoprotein diacylglyceryltransferase